MSSRRIASSSLVAFNVVANEPMRHLNAKLGYVPQPIHASFRGPLAE